MLTQTLLPTALLALSASASPLTTRANPTWSLSFFPDTTCSTSALSYNNVTLSGSTFQKCQNLGGGEVPGSALVTDTHSDSFATGVYSIQLYTGDDCSGGLYVPLQALGKDGGDGVHWSYCRKEAVRSFFVAVAQSG